MQVLLSRSREGAWIEIFSFTCLTVLTLVAPVRERGLKYYITNKQKKIKKSLP